jgi:hypothetical protein
MFNSLGMSCDRWDRGSFPGCSSARQLSEPDPLDFFEGDIVRRAVVRFRCPGRLVGRNMGARFEGTAVLEVDGDAGRAETVVGNPALDAACFGAALDDAEGVDAGHALGRELVGATASGPENRSFGVVLHTGRRDVRIEILLGLVMAGDFMELHVLFVETQPGALALRVVVLDEHADHSRHSGEAVEHHRDECGIAQANDGVVGNRIEELTRLFSGQYRRFALLDDVFWPTHGRRRI